MSRRAFPADAAPARPAPNAWASTWVMPAPWLLSEYVLNTLAVVVAAGLLFWLWPSLLSSPFDGVFTYLNMAQTYQWQAPGAPLGGYYPLEGLGSRLMPSIPALMPHTYSVWLADDPSVRVWLTYLILAGMLGLGALAYFRAAGASRGTAIAATWMTLVLSLTLSDLIQATWGVLSAQVGMLVALALFLQVGRGQRARAAFWLAAFVVFVVLFVLTDHVFNGYVAGPPLAFMLLVHLLAAPARAERLWKLAALVGAGLVVVALGIPQWMLALAASTSRAIFFDELIAQPQHAYTAGMIFRSTDAFTLVYVLAIVGMLGDLALGDRRQRACAAMIAVMSIGLAAAGLVWLLTDLKWRPPAPVFYNVAIFPWLALAAVRGVDHALSWHAERSGRPELRRDRLPLVVAIVVAAFLGLKLAFGTATPITVGLVLVLSGAVWLARRPGSVLRRPALAVYSLAIVVVLLNGNTISVERLLDGPEDNRNSIQRLFAVSPPFTRLLRDQVGLTPGSPFRGYADFLVLEKQVPMLVPVEILSWHAREIPTLSQYTYYLSPAYHALVTRLLNDPGDRPNVNHMAITRLDIRLMRMLGLRYLMVKDDLDAPGLRRVDRQGVYRLYELPDPNLASYSPTRVERVPDARSVLARLAEPGFDPRSDVLVTEQVASAVDLVPASETSLTFVRGGFELTARSSGRSLVVLPVQFSRCLELRVMSGTSEATAVRANLVTTTIVFSGDVVLAGRLRFGGPWERCVQDDIADVDRLGLRELVERRRVPEYSFPGPRLRVFAPFGLD